MEWRVVEWWLNGWMEAGWSGWRMHGVDNGG